MLANHVVWLTFFVNVLLCRLIFSGKQMNDDKLAKDFNIEGGSVLHLVGVECIVAGFCVIYADHANARCTRLCSTLSPYNIIIMNGSLPVLLLVLLIAMFSTAAVAS